MVVPSWDTNKSGKTCRVEEAMPGEEDEPKAAGMRKRGSRREHMRSPAYYSCTDGAADEMGGIDG